MSQDPLSDAAVAPKRQRGKWRLAASGVVLSAATLWIFHFIATEEPFAVYRRSDFALVVGLGTITFVLFVGWAIACVYNFRHASSTSSAPIIVFASVLWTVINLVFLGGSIDFYKDDLRRFARRARLEALEKGSATRSP